MWKTQSLCKRLLFKRQEFLYNEANVRTVKSKYASNRVQNYRKNQAPHRFQNDKHSYISNRFQNKRKSLNESNVYSNTKNSRPCIKLKMAEKNITALIDSGAETSVLSYSVFRKIPRENILYKVFDDAKLTTANKDTIKRDKYVYFIRFEIDGKFFTAPFVIIHTKGDGVTVILGADFLDKQKYVLDGEHMCLKLNGHLFPIISNANCRIGVSELVRTKVNKYVQRRSWQYIHKNEKRL